MYATTKMTMMSPSEIDLGTSNSTYPAACRYSSASLTPTHAMMTNAASTRVGYFCTSVISCPTTSRSATMPSTPPVMTTHILGDITAAMAGEIGRDPDLTPVTL